MALQTLPNRYYDLSDLKALLNRLFPNGGWNVDVSSNCNTIRYASMLTERQTRGDKYELRAPRKLTDVGKVKFNSDLACQITTAQGRTRRDQTSIFERSLKRGQSTPE